MHREVLELFEDKSVWQKSLARQHLLNRLIRRFAKAGTRADLISGARLFELAPDADAARILMGGFEQAYKGRSMAALPDRLMAAMARHGGGSVALELRRGEPKAVEEALRVIVDVKAEKLLRLQYTEILGEAPNTKAVPVLLGVVKNEPGSDLKRAALGALKPYDDTRVAEETISIFPELQSDLRQVAGTLLAGRTIFAAAFVNAVEAGKISVALVSPEVVSLLRTHTEPTLAGKVNELFSRARNGFRQVGNGDHRLARLVRQKLEAHTPAKNFSPPVVQPVTSCSSREDRIGPDLTTYQRDDIDTMLLHIVNPSAEIREGYENFLLTTKDGRMVVGFWLEQNNQTVVLQGLDGQDISLERKDIKTMNAQGVSLMPAGLLTGYTDDQVQDLMAYLRSATAR